MIKQFVLAAALVLSANAPSFAQGEGPSDPQIAHIAYTAGALDVAAAELALDKSKNKEVRAFAETMKRDHEAVNEKALALVEKLGVKPEDNPTSQGLAKAAKAKEAELDKLEGAEFDRAYIANEIAYHATVNGALRDALIPSADNDELKALLEAGLKLFTEHQKHAEHLAEQVK